MNKSQKIYDSTYLDIAENYITLYQQNFITLGDLRDCFNALASAIRGISLNLCDDIIDKANDLENIYAGMLDANRKILLDYEYKIVEQNINSIIELISMCRIYIQSSKVTNKESSHSQILYNSRYLLMMEDYLSIYRQGFISLSDLKTNLDALAYALCDFSPEMALHAVSQKWQLAIEQQTIIFNSLYNTMLNEQRKTLLGSEQELVTKALFNIAQLITEYKTNFRECLRHRSTYNPGTGIVTAPLKGKTK